MCVKTRIKTIVRKLRVDIESFFESYSVKNALTAFTTDTVVQQLPQKPHSILFILPAITESSGGITSVLRLGTYLSSHYDIAYAVTMEQNKRDMEKSARTNLTGYKGDLLTFGELRKLIEIEKNAARRHRTSECRRFDVIIATRWDTALFAKQMYGYKMYFVQDYEPYFYPFGERFIFAQKTYEQGFHMVCLGAWCAQMIKANCVIDSRLDIVDFPYEPAEYPEIKRDFSTYAGKTEIKIAVYIKSEGSRLPNLIPWMMSELSRLFAEDHKKLTVRYFGASRHSRLKAGVNLGQMDKKSLRSLYKDSDFGLCASMSNISLVPYEMLGSGLPLIEFADGTFPYFFSGDCAILTGLSAEDLYSKLMSAISDPRQMARRSETARIMLRRLSWRKTAEQFRDIIESVGVLAPVIQGSTPNP
jgi:glycosyltransferase involved in cell wall biosynthesis